MNPYQANFYILSLEPVANGFIIEIFDSHNPEVGDVLFKHKLINVTKNEFKRILMNYDHSLFRLEAITEKVQDTKVLFSCIKDVFIPEK